MTDSLRTRIAAVLPKIFDRIADGELVEWGDMADAVIRELDTELLDFGLWLSEELRGWKMNRRDLESCIEDWRGTADE